MARLDHIELAVKDWRASRDWWRDHLGFEVEFEDESQRMAALRDSADLTVFLCQDDTVVVPPRFSLAIQVDDVDGSHQILTGLGLGLSTRRPRCSGATAPNCSIPTATACGSGTRPA